VAICNFKTKNECGRKLRPPIIIGAQKIIQAKMKDTIVIPDEVITNKIYFIRNQKVMLDKDLAELYQVETKRINEQIKRNLEKFPENFMFQLTESEFQNLKSQIATSSWGGSRKLPYVFTEYGVLQLATVLRSERATQMSIKIIELFVQMREILMLDLNIKLEIEEIKKKLSNHSKNIELVFNYLDELIEKKDNKKVRPQIGFKK
jgi:ORF6N domain